MGKKYKMWKENVMKVKSKVKAGAGCCIDPMG